MMKEVKVTMTLRVDDEQPVEDWIILAVEENLDHMIGEMVLEYSDDEPIIQN